MNVKFKNFSISLFLSIIVLSSADAIHAEDNSMDTRQVILALFEAFNRHDTESMVALYSKDAEVFSPGNIEPRVGPDAIREIYDGHFDNIPGVHNAVQNIIVDGDRGSVEFVASWSQATKDDLNARGKLKIAAFITINDGKIIRDVAYFDRVGFSEN
jgi:ketosteroid isomerase-like protein